MIQRILSRSSLPLISLLATLAACGHPEPVAPKSVTVRHDELFHTVRFSGRSTTLSADEFQSLRDFAAAVPASEVTYVGIDGDTVHQPAAKRIARLKSFLAGQGIDPAALHVTHNRRNAGNVVIVSLQYTQGVPPGPCPDWSKNAIHNYDNSNASNFGCAYNANIAAQLANPQDYVRGHTSLDTDPARNSAAVQKYETGATSASGSGASADSGGGSTTTTTTTPPQ